MNNDQMNNDQLQEDLTEVLRVRRDKLAKLQEMGRDPFQVSRYDRTSNSTEIKGSFEEFEGKIVKIAGRIMSKRIQGKAGFIDIQDQEGRIQCYKLSPDLLHRYADSINVNSISNFGDVICWYVICHSDVRPRFRRK